MMLFGRNDDKSSGESSVYTPCTIFKSVYAGNESKSAHLECTIVNLTADASYRFNITGENSYGRVTDVINATALNSVKGN